MVKRAALLSWIVSGTAAMALAQVRPTAPAQETLKFDVASVKVVDRNTLTGRGGGVRTSGGPGTSDPGRFSDPVDTMLGMLMKAFGAGTGEILGPAVEARVGGNLYSVMATMPPETTKAQFQVMFQNLLAERFHLVFHHETRNFPAYELVVDKGGPKLKEGASQTDDGPTPTNPMRVNFQNASSGNITLNTNAEYKSACAASCGQDRFNR